MKCHRCGTELVRGSPNCPSCGSPAQGACPNCGSLNEPDHNFCFSCGQGLTNEVEEATGGPIAAEASPEITPITPTTPVAQCPRCREINVPGVPFCRGCGVNLNEPSYRTGAGLSHIAAFSLGEPGGFWWRALAYLIDIGLLFGALALIWPLIAEGSMFTYYESILFPPEDLDLERNLYAEFFIGARDIIYFTATVGIWRATVGMLVCKLQVVRCDGSRVGIGRALARYFASQLSFLIFGVGVAMVAFRVDKRALHDIICDTVVIRRAAPSTELDAES